MNKNKLLKRGISKSLYSSLQILMTSIVY